MTAHSNRSFNFLELANHVLPHDVRNGLMVVKENEMHRPVFPNGCAICEVEVDPDTGSTKLTRYTSVDDVGRCINPMIVHGQAHGAITQGVGQALSEQCYTDPTSGQPLCGSFMDYAMPRADDLPSLRTEVVEILSPTNPLGIKSAGEGPTTPAPAAVINAIVHALSHYGIRDIKMPATPLTVWHAIHEAQTHQASIR